MQDLLTEISEIIQSGAGIALVVIGLIVGIILALIINAARGKSSGSGSSAALDELQNEFDDYKDQVTSHFARTSELVGQLTSDYRAVYEHLATSADKLCTTDASGQPLGFPQVELIQSEKVVSDEGKSSVETDDSSADQEPETTAAETATEVTAEESAAKDPETAADAEKPEDSASEAPVAASIPDSIASDSKK